MLPSNFLTALGWAVINSLWQFAALWILFQLLVAIFPKTSSATRATLATLNIFAGFAWFGFTFLSQLNSDTSISEAIPYLYAPKGWNFWLESFLPVASTIYLILLTIPIFQFIRNYRFVQFIRRYGLQKADVKWRLFVQNLSAHMGIKKKVEIFISEWVQSPVTIGYLKPIILIPVAAINQLETKQVEAILLHELAHIRRFDYLLNLVLRFIQSVLYYNPLVKQFVRVVEVEREKSCDEQVITFQYNAHDYATALLALEKSQAHYPQNLAVAASGNRKKQLLSRIENIMGIHKNRFTGVKLANMMMAATVIAVTHLFLHMKKPSQIGDISSPLVSTSLAYIYQSPAKQSGAGFGFLPIAQSSVPATPPVLDAAIGTDLATDEIINDKDENPFGQNFYHVTNLENVLNEQQETEVKSAATASRKILQDYQWKTINQKLGDAFTLDEKENIRQKLAERTASLPLDIVEENLRKEYAEINWMTLNKELEINLQKIMIDSLQREMEYALAEITNAERELQRSKLSGIPDTDLTLQNLHKQKEYIFRQIGKLHKARAKKVIHL